MIDPTRNELINHLVQIYEDAMGEPYEDAEDAFFIVERAAYWLAADYHGGMNSNLYEALSVSPYSPGLVERGPGDCELYLQGCEFIEN